MADKVFIYGGNEADMPELQLRELGICTDSFKLFTGSSEGENKLIGAVVWGEDITTLKNGLKSLNDAVDNVKDVLDDKLTANKAESVAVVAENATAADIATAFNSLLDSLKAAGIMNT